MRCFFGCKGHPLNNKDSLKQYMYCKPLWDIVLKVTGIDCGPLKRAPAVRLSIHNPNIHYIYCFVLLFRVYHGLKNDYLSKVINSRSIDNFEEISLIAVNLAKFHWNEISGQKLGTFSDMRQDEASGTA